ncbi:UNVERIFIED_CONTAM: hypothetical protein FKN15_039999 [Acipenser sinensis]
MPLDHSSKGSFGCLFVYVPGDYPRRADTQLTCIPGPLQQREPVPNLPVLREHSSRGNLYPTHLCFWNTPAEGACTKLTRGSSSLQQREFLLNLPVVPAHSSRGSFYLLYLCSWFTPLLRKHLFNTGSKITKCITNEDYSSVDLKE